jgi:hypothetical protein
LNLKLKYSATKDANLGKFTRVTIFYEKNFFFHFVSEIFDCLPFNKKLYLNIGKKISGISFPEKQGCQIFLGTKYQNGEKDICITT